MQLNRLEMSLACYLLFVILYTGSTYIKYVLRRCDMEENQLSVCHFGSRARFRTGSQLSFSRTWDTLIRKWYRRGRLCVLLPLQRWPLTLFLVVVFAQSDPVQVS